MSNLAKDLVRKLLTRDPKRRINVDQVNLKPALAHPLIGMGLLAPRLRRQLDPSPPRLIHRLITLATLATLQALQHKWITEHIHADMAEPVMLVRGADEGHLVWDRRMRAALIMWQLKKDLSTL